MKWISTSVSSFGPHAVFDGDEGWVEPAVIPGDEHRVEHGLGHAVGDGDLDGSKSSRGRTILFSFLLGREEESGGRKERLQMQWLLRAMVFRSTYIRSQLRWPLQGVRC